MKAVKKYGSFFRLRFAMGLQYRAAALAGIVTQFAWGFLEIMVYWAFYEAEPQNFPMTFEATTAYIWLQQAFLAFFVPWMVENEIFDAILNGNVAYEMCRPVDMYWMWFSRSVANRFSRAALRCFPILIVAAFLPAPYRMMGPACMADLFWFLVTVVLGLLVMVAFCMLIYMLAFFTVSAQGLRILFVSCVEFFSGAVIPLPFFPEGIRDVMELLPFAAMQNVPLRIYGGNLHGEELRRAVILQVFWLFVLILLGKMLEWKAVKRIVLQGG